MRTPMKKQRSCKGTTAIELVLSTAILVLILGFAGLLGSTGQGAYLESNAKTGQELRARRALDRVTSELATAGQSTLFPTPGGFFGTDEVTFQQAVGAAGTTAQWGPLTRIRLEYEPGETDDGTDENGDGLVDEGRLVLTRNLGAAGEQSIVMCSGVSELLEGETPAVGDDNGNGLVDEPGFCLSLEDDVLTIRLTLMLTRREGAPRLCTLETALKLRN